MRAGLAKHTCLEGAVPLTKSPDICTGWRASGLTAALSLKLEPALLQLRQPSTDGLDCVGELLPLTDAGLVPPRLYALDHLVGLAHQGQRQLGVCGALLATLVDVLPLPWGKADSLHVRSLCARP